MDDAQKSEGGPAATKKPAIQRSPTFPMIDIAAAIERTRQFYKLEKRNTANVAVALSHWGYSPLSSGGKQTLAALLSYGLLVDEGSNDKRTVRLTDLGLRIILDERPDSAEREAAIRRAALMPKLHQEVDAKWPGFDVSDASLKHYLLIDRKFNENGAQDFIKELRATVKFAKLDSRPDNRGEDEPSPGLPQIKVGDWVRWESGGSVQFHAKRVAWLSDDGTFARVDDSQTGLPVQELTAVQPPEPDPTPKGASMQVVSTGPVIGAANNPPGPSTIGASAVGDPQRLTSVTKDFSVSWDIEREWLRGSLSKRTGYKLIVTGEMGAKEIGKLIKLLEAQKLVLEDDDDSTDSGLA